MLPLRPRGALFIASCAFASVAFSPEAWRQQPGTPPQGVRPSSSEPAALAPPLLPAEIERALSIQVRLDRAGFSPGVIDAAAGPNLRRAALAFQRARRLVVTGEPDAGTAEALETTDTRPVLAAYTVSPEDVRGPFVPAIPKDMMAQAALPSLAYTSLSEALAERFHTTPQLLRRLNPHARFDRAGEVVHVPAVDVLPWPVASGEAPTPPDLPKALVRVSRETGALTVEGDGGAVLLHAPVTVGSEHDPLPVGEWAITLVFLNPLFNYNPDLFWDADPAHAKARIRPGPNNPVGVAWIGLTREHYGIHGTPEPTRIGKTESHGCVRLTNWDVLRAARLVARGTRVIFE